MGNIDGVRQLIAAEGGGMDGRTLNYKNTEDGVSHILTTILGLLGYSIIVYVCMYVCMYVLYLRSGNFHCQIIFVGCLDHENRKNTK